MSHRGKHLPLPTLRRPAAARRRGARPCRRPADPARRRTDRQPRFEKTASPCMDLLNTLHKSGATICMVTHDDRFANHARRTCICSTAVSSRKRSSHEIGPAPFQRCLPWPVSFPSRGPARLSRSRGDPAGARTQPGDQGASLFPRHRPCNLLTAYGNSPGSEFSTERGGRRKRPPEGSDHGLGRPARASTPTTTACLSTASFPGGQGYSIGGTSEISAERTTHFATTSRRPAA